MLLENPGLAGIGDVVHSPSGLFLWGGSFFFGLTTNNVAEVEIVLEDLKKTSSFRCIKLLVKGDSQVAIADLSNGPSKDWELNNLEKKLIIVFVHKWVVDCLTSAGINFPL